MAAALIGSYIESMRFRAAFPHENERAEDALMRVRPLAAILVDALADASESDLFMARARKKKVSVFLFGSPDAVDARRAWAAERVIPTFVIPYDLERLQEALERVSTDGQNPRRTAGRRAHTERAPDGTLIFDDGAGHRWSVYDRRGGDRRKEIVDREFVSEEGEVRHCDLSLDAAKEVT